ncbi:MAG TPA: hypothetical protein VH619_17050 [Verrucomicrobiae bacterium]|jgi:hypothetical protein|nr:hypothetical protein [Verrucomicrobiae bacterium]
MKLERIPHNPGQLLEFYEEGLTKLGALCERTWHDRLEVVAEGPAARLWHPDGAIHEIELQFAPAEAASARNAIREIFPGCPLTFHLTEALRISPLPLERFILPEDPLARPPDATVMEKLWRAQFPDTHRWRLAAPLQPDIHFALLALARCEIQAMDQHWSLHRIAASLTDGEPDPDLSRNISFHQITGDLAAEIAWPPPDPARLRELLSQTLERELAGELDRIRSRQENSLRRELARIDDYFESYERELTVRATRSSSENSRLKTADRLAAAKAEHARRRADQLARHEIRVHPHLDALLLVAEKGWRAQLRLERSRHPGEVEALFVPRLRQWKLAGRFCQT